jgi:hypothetical protein
MTKEYNYREAACCGTCKYFSVYGNCEKQNEYTDVIGTCDMYCKKLVSLCEMYGIPRHKD